LYDWLLFLHLLSALLVFGTVAVFSAFAFGATNDGRILRVGNVLWDVSGAGLLVFGIWLALYVDGYSLLDGWILGALVLFAITTELGRRAKAGYEAEAGSQQVAVSGNAALWHWLRTIVILAILYLMIYKPGA
jgi:uncharacterized membrane protein